MKRGLLFGFLLGQTVAGPVFPAGEPTAPTVEIARGGNALLPLVVAPSAPESVKVLAREMADHLHRITGASFEVGADATASGVVLGTSADFPGLLPDPPPGRSPLLLRDDYLLRTEPGRVLLIGRDPHGVRNAMWDFFYRLGFRQFFPGKNWEIWPREQNLAVSFDTFQSPSYFTRNIFLGGSTWPENQAAFRQWKIRNRMESGFTLNTSHAYGAIIKRNRGHFEAHPEDIVPGGKPGTSKLDASRETVLDLVARDAVAQFQRDPELDSISMDPSDGGGWRKNSPAGSSSDQAVTLANQAARAIQEQFPGRKVGMYAYHEHADPPDVPVDPHVIVSVATSFLRDGHSVEDLLSRWQSKGVELGIREYLSVWGWDKDLPGRARATELTYLEKTIPLFYQLGARYWTSEASDGWGAQGLGTYLASRLLWDVGAVSEIPAVLDDFYTRSFGEAAPEMRRFFQLVLAEGKPLLSGDLLGRMYRTLDEALAKSGSPEITARILDLAIYTRSIELLLAYQNSEESARLPAYEELARFVYRTRHSGMVNGGAVFRMPAARDAKQFKGMDWRTAEAHHPLKDAAEVTPESLREDIRRGIEAHALMDFESVRFSDDLVPPEPPFPDGPPGGSFVVRGTNRLYLQAAGEGVPFQFSIRGGVIYGSRGPVKLRLFAAQNPLPNDPVATAEVPPDKAFHEIQLLSSYPGAHWLEIADGGDATEISWPTGQAGVWPASPTEHVSFHGGYDAVFFVPAGTKVVGGFSDTAAGCLVTADGEVKFDFQTMKGPGYFSVPISEEKGTWWRFQKTRGKKLLLTVPAHLARSAGELLVPRETWKTP